MLNHTRRVFAQVRQGAASPDELADEEAELGEMSSQLETLRSSYDTLWGQASGVLKNLAGGSPGGSGSGGAAGGSPKPGGTQSAGAEAASRALVTGLKFSGLAMRITQDIASAVKADAERMFKVRFVCVSFNVFWGCGDSVQRHGYAYAAGQCKCSERCR